MPLHPFIASMLNLLREAEWPGLSAGTPEDARKLFAMGRRAMGRGPDLQEVREFQIPTRAGSIPARLYRPANATGGLAVYLHGGGWMLGTLDDYDALARVLAGGSRTALLLPEYRLAPEHPFPAGLEDCEDCVRWAAQAGPQLGCPGPLVLAGDSAGGNFTAVIARRLRGQVPIALQILVYPPTDVDLDRESYRTMSEGMPLTREDMVWFLGHYASPPDYHSPDISPLRAPDLTGLPPALVITAEYDILRDEGEAYARALERAGVTVRRERIAGLTHGFLRLPGQIAPVTDTIALIAEAIRTAATA